MINTLPKITSKGKKRVGRGYGSGKGGHTVGRGQKGQKARGKVGLLFEGTKVKKSLIQRLPVMRGKGRFKPKVKPLPVKLSYLNRLKEGSRVTVQLLVKEGIVSPKAIKRGVKLVGGGKLEKRLKILVPISKRAETLNIEK